MDITIAKSQLNLVKALQLCFNVYFIDKETLAALHGGGIRRRRGRPRLRWEDFVKGDLTGVVGEGRMRKVGSRDGW